MDIISAVLIIIGLAAFETVASIDNAIINADILSTMRDRARRWFLTWGILIAVFVIRGLLPWLIIWFSTPSLGPVGAITVTFSGDPAASAAIEHSAPYLLLAGGIFLIYLFLHWLMAEQKNCIVPGELAMSRHAPWFYAVAGIFLFAVVFNAVNVDPYLCLAAAGGSAVFFVMQGFRLFADSKSAELAQTCNIAESHADAGNLHKADISKLMLLEVIDATFSIDGVIGAFAFTISVPLILIGNGLGAVIVRELTVRNIENIKKYAYLKNGAMYSIFILGIIMCAEGFGIEIPTLVAPLCTIGIVSIFFYLSIRRIRKGIADEC